MKNPVFILIINSCYAAIKASYIAKGKGLENQNLSLMKGEISRTRTLGDYSSMSWLAMNGKPLVSSLSTDLLLLFDLYFLKYPT